MIGSAELGGHVMSVGHMPVVGHVMPDLVVLLTADRDYSDDSQCGCYHDL